MTMNTQQPEALVLANYLEGAGTLPSDQIKAAAELRRLHSVNAELLEELQKALPCLREFGIGNQFKNAVAAIDKAQG